MEKFVLVGILCAHVMVALRPTIGDTLRMLEGDMDVPELPDRPLPYGHSLMFSEAGSDFSASPAFSGPLAPFITLVLAVSLMVSAALADFVGMQVQEK